MVTYIKMHTNKTHEKVYISYRNLSGLNKELQIYRARIVTLLKLVNLFCLVGN